MYIKSIVIDGFKSYGQRTEINGFDKLFNAITGLNGSGKSNILDAICFLLGISNLSLVRATNLQELVYKNGQAGVTKANVSIIFDNVDKTQSPIGYQQCDEITVTRQVVIGGRNKYLINGCNAQNNRVQDLFRSVQLNVNNPHFLIMQGRITKVLNMKPIEILGMIEEAAGTKMYETKKETALKTIAKKDAKLADIKTAIDEEISPTLEKLKEDRAAYLEFQTVQREVEHLTKLCVAYQFVVAEASCKSTGVTLEKMRGDMKSTVETVDKAENEIKNLEKGVKEIEKQSKTGMETLKDLENDLREHEKRETKLLSEVDNVKDNLKTEEKKKADIVKNRDDDVASAEMREREIAVVKKDFEKLSEISKRDSEAVEKAKQFYHAVSIGLSKNSDGEAAATLANQLMVAKSEIAENEMKRKQSELMLAHVTEKLVETRGTSDDSANTYRELKRAHKKCTDEIQQIHEKIGKTGFNAEQHQQMMDTKRMLENEVSKMSSELEMLESRFPHLIFRYKDPEPNWNRSRVKGFVCKLFSVKKPEFERALETAAGGKMYNIVLDTDATGKALFEKGELRRKVTFLPLNKISSYPIRADVIARAKQLVGDDNVESALRLIDYEPSLHKAMEYVFGGTLVCKDSGVAKKVAFHNDVRANCVTLDGDVFRPSGVISGGNMVSVPILMKLKEIFNVKMQLESKRKELKDVTDTLSKLSSAMETFNTLKIQLEMKERELGTLNADLQRTTHHNQLQKIQEYEENIKELKSCIETCKEKGTAALKKSEEIEAKMKDSKRLKEQEFKDAEKQVNEANRVFQESSEAMKKKEQELVTLQLEKEDFDKGKVTYEEQISAVDNIMKGFTQKLEELNQMMREVQEIIAGAKEKVEKQKGLVKEYVDRIESAHVDKTALLKTISESKLKLQQMGHEEEKMKTAVKDAAHQVEHLRSTHKWIAEEQKYFGLPNTGYDFAANDPKESSRRLHVLKEKKSKLEKNVNTRAMNMLGEAEEQYNKLLDKKRIVENDRTSIEAVIKELDEKKKATLKSAWNQVNQDLGSIFATLLPGARAKLVPSSGKSVLDGLEIKVAFGEVWKESLNELSGGQRSLVALSLVLALLLFKPAPIYILDEVDAALDISHTQNIGEMLRTHFKHSQFIVVSLKNGMFSNANVLFETKFIDGMSTVSRTAQSQVRR